MRRIRVSIMGAAGYVGAELLRLILLHPATDLVCAQSRSQAGKKLYNVHPDLLGETELEFCAELETKVDVLFLCMAHGEAKNLLASNSLASVPHIIDLSQDFRLKETSQDFVYGLSEWNREAIVKARHIANPGCFATAIQLAVLPLLAARLISSELYVNGITGSTGAGQALSASSHFSWRANNISIYKALQHQHLFEIRESIQSIHPDFKEAIHFVPYRGDFTRGIFCSVQTRCDAELEVVLDVFRETYKKSFFVFISEQTVDLKQVINTNKCFISCEKEGNQLIVSVAIDNLLKGAAGQAVQNMNLLFGVPEKTGLHLKASAF